MSVITRVLDYKAELSSIRQDIHMHPETAFEEVRTSDLVARKLAEYGCEVHRGLAKTGVVGTLLGLLGGYFGGKVDAFVVYLINVKLALPIVLVALALASIAGGSIASLILILGFLTWDRYAVVVRSVTQQLRAQDFIAAAQAAGASHLRIVLGEVLPNVFNQIIVVASLEIALVILIEAGLSFQIGRAHV
mgnify:CR=1 FL=1